MPFIPPPPTAVLPLIDVQPSQAELAAAQQLIQAELDKEDTTDLHPLINPASQSHFSDLIEQEHASLASGAAKSNTVGIDLTRYDAPDAPADNADKAAWTAALRQAYTSLEYLQGREMNLGLLEAYGKNAWLVSNSALEDELKAVERDVEVAKQELEATEQARRQLQEGAEGEMKGLEEGWRVGVGRMIEAQAAGEALRMEMLERRRRGAS
jgi:pre-mRNA-splicing factor SPF27